MQTLKKGSKKLLWAWAFYDWANSAYNLVITSAIFPIFYSQIFKEKGNQWVDFCGYQINSTAMITFVTSFAFLIVAILSPILSGIADFVGNKKIFLRFLLLFRRYFLYFIILFFNPKSIFKLPNLFTKPYWLLV